MEAALAGKNFHVQFALVIRRSWRTQPTTQPGGFRAQPGGPSRTCPREARETVDVAPETRLPVSRSSFDSLTFSRLLAAPRPRKLWDLLRLRLAPGGPVERVPGQTTLPSEIATQ